MKITTFTVEGRGAFPFDMLRYDNCFPDTSEDAFAIAETMLKNIPQAVRRIALRSQHNKLKGHEITPARWASFGWHVIESYTRKLT